MDIGTVLLFSNFLDTFLDVVLLFLNMGVSFGFALVDGLGGYMFYGVGVLTVMVVA